jgi:hypothetical protein
MNDSSFIRNGKEWGESKTEREKDQIKGERQREAEKGLRHGS